MTAKEMFEELGYIIKKNEENILVYECRQYDKNVTFYKLTRFISYTKNYTSVSLLQAMFQQCKELGWLDE